ncbi:MAG: hypothetical protein HQK75_08000 [Candidatus Magnetomorum sp.]|nr:hypothetical protein [Candidatus Magnetomorum sp.]
MNVSKLRFIFFIFFFIANHSSCLPPSTSCQSPSIPSSQQKRDHSNDSCLKKVYKIPEWFIEKPQIPEVNLVYAYCSQYFNKVTEKKKILLSAAENIAKSKNVSLSILQKGTLQTGKYISKTEILESDVFIDKETLEDNYTIINQFPIGTGILALVAETAQLRNVKLYPIKNALKTLEVCSPPKWVTVLPSQKGFIFGVGSAQDHSSPEKAWKAAEKDARANIALQQNAALQYKNNAFQTSMLEWLTTHHQISASMMLTNVSIIKHGFCQPYRTYYALARMKVADDI